AKLAGLLDEVSLYNVALSSAQITAIYNAGSAGKCRPSRTVVITCSTNGGAILLPANSVLIASAFSSNAVVTNVSFYSASTLLGSSTNGTDGIFSFAWTNPPTGTTALS